MNTPASVDLHPAWKSIALTIAAFTRENTKKAYLADLKNFLRWLGVEWGGSDVAPLLHFSCDQRLAYRLHLQALPGNPPRRGSVGTKDIALRSPQDAPGWTLSTATIARKEAALCRIWDGLQARGIVKTNPWRDPSLPKLSSHWGTKRPTEMIPIEDVRLILSVAQKRATVKGLRDYCLLALLFGCGLRASEARLVCIGDIRRELETDYILVRAPKGHRDRKAVMPPWTYQVVKQWLKVRDKHRALDHSPLLCTLYGKQKGKTGMSIKGVYSAFRGALLRAGITGDYSPHSARATAITKLLSEGYSHREVQDFSGHASVMTVERYDKRRNQIQNNPGLTLKY
jgi:integrase/recombinase XerD